MEGKRSQAMLVGSKTKALEASSGGVEVLIGPHGMHEEHPLRQPMM